jgi:4-azaleucine resistance transporter AzlC
MCFREERTELGLFFKGVRQIIPVSAAGIVDGMVFGILSHQAGLSITETVLMSLLVNAGSSQFAAIGFISQGIVGWPILLATALLNSRQLLYGISLGPYFRKTSWWKLSLMGGLLHDETFALKSTYLAGGGKASLPYFIGAGLLDYVVWIISTLSGVYFGSWVSHPEQFGLDFAFIATFLGFLAVNLFSRFHIMVAICSAVAACFGYWILGTSAAVITGTLTAIIIGVLVREP